MLEILVDMMTECAPLPLKGSNRISVLTLARESQHNNVMSVSPEVSTVGTSSGLWLQRSSVRRLLVTANVVPSSPILVTLMMEALSFFETSVLIRATWRNVPEDGILYILIRSPFYA
jgi:hypothetical protein